MHSLFAVGFDSFHQKCGRAGQLDKSEVELGESLAAPDNYTNVPAIGDSLAWTALEIWPESLVYGAAFRPEGGGGDHRLGQHRCPRSHSVCPVSLWRRSSMQVHTKDTIATENCAIRGRSD